MTFELLHYFCITSIECKVFFLILSLLTLDISFFPPFSWKICHFFSFYTVFMYIMSFSYSVLLLVSEGLFDLFFLRSYTGKRQQK